MNIQDIIQRISNYNKIDINVNKKSIEENECIFQILVDKYNKNNNSIFESNELELIVGDLCNFAKEDEDKESLSETEAQHFLESMLSNGQTLLDYIKDPRANLEYFVKKIFYELDTAGKETLRRDFIKKYKTDFNNFYDKKIIKELNDEEFEQVKILFSMNVAEQLETYEIEALAKLSPKEFERAKGLFNVSGRKEQFDGSGIATLAKLTPKEFERAKGLFNVSGRKEQFNGSGIAALAKLTDEEFERAKGFFKIKGRKKQLSGENIAAIVRLDETKIERVMNLLTLKDSHTKFNFESGTEYTETIDRFDGDNIERLADLDNEHYERAKKLFYIKGRSSQFDGLDIKSLVTKLNDDELKQAITISKKFSHVYEIIPLAKLTKKEYERAKKLFYLIDSESENRFFDGKDIANLAKLEDDELARAKSLLNIKNNGEYFSIEEACQLATKSTDDDIKWIKKYLLNKSYDTEDIIRIVESRSNEIEEILSSGNKVRISYTAGDCVKLLYTKDNEIICKTFDKSGAFEREWKNTITYPNFDNCNQTVLYNKKLKVAHVVTRGQVGVEEESYPIELEEFLTYFDEKGAFKKVVEFVKNPENGLLNVSETDKYGNKIPIQWDSIDPHTGAKIIEKHLTSPLGVKTDFYCEEKDELKQTEYKITKEGKTLLNVRQTFQKISDNKFISSVNATGKDENTQIYEIEYRDANIVDIFDKKNNKKTTIDLSKYFNNSESAEKLMPVIKRLPGHILLKFAEKPFQLQYGKNNFMNGYWKNFGKTLEVGNNENVIGGEEENMYNILVHEIGHYLDLYNFNPKFSTDPEILSVYNKEFQTFKQHSTSIQQKYIAYFTDIFFAGSSEERTAEAHALAHSKNDPLLSTRKLYLAQSIPETLALIIKRELEEYGIQTEYV